jgi:hypothetical protein
MTLTTTPGVFHGANASAAWQLYCYIADGAMQGRAVRKEEPLLALTEHPVSETERIIVAVNQSETRGRVSTFYNLVLVLWAVGAVDFAAWQDL